MINSGQIDFEVFKTKVSHHKDECNKMDDDDRKFFGKIDSFTLEIFKDKIQWSL